MKIKLSASIYLFREMPNNIAMHEKKGNNDKLFINFNIFGYGKRKH